MANLVLGIGNFSKPILEACEPNFPQWVFAVLDFWSVVQEIKFVASEARLADCTVRNQENLSYFVSKPKLSVRFGSKKYIRTQTQTVLPYTIDYRKAIGESLNTNLQQISVRLLGYSRIMIVVDSIDEIGLECLPSLLPLLKKSGTDLQAVSSYPLSWQGALMIAYADKVNAILENNTKNHCSIFQQEILAQCADATLPMFFDKVKTCFCKELHCLL
jgi:hypothetical protein